MPTSLRIAAAVSLSVLLPAALPSAARAQAETGTGGGAASTVTAPNTSTVGRTKPPGAAAGASTADEKRVRTPKEKKDDKIQQGICIGCGTK